MDRVLSAARLHLVHPLVMVGVPWAIVASSFVLNLGIWSITRLGAEDGAGTGGLAALYFTVLVVYSQAVTQVLPFGMGMGLSRRAFYLGTAVAAGAQAVAYAVVLAVLAAVEDATGGWWVGLQFWGPPVVEAGNPVMQVTVYAVPLLAFSAVGVAFGVVFKRWGGAGVWTVLIALLLLLGGTIALIGWLQAWRDVIDWFAGQTMLTMAVGVPLALTAVAGALSFAGLRRVVP